MCSHFTSSFCKKSCCLCCFIFTWTSTYDQRVQLIIIFFQITTNHQRSHTMSEQMIWKFSPISFFHPCCYLMSIFYDRFSTVIIKIPKVCRIFDTLTMTSVIMDHTDIAIVTQHLHKRLIAFFMFCHTVADLYDSLWRLFWFHKQYM